MKPTFIMCAIFALSYFSISAFADFGVVYHHDPMAIDLHLTSPDGKYIAEIGGDAGTTNVLIICRRPANSMKRKVAWYSTHDKDEIVVASGGVDGASWIPGHPHMLVFEEEEEDGQMLRMWNGGKIIKALISSPISRDDDLCIRLTGFSKNGSTIFYALTKYDNVSGVFTYRGSKHYAFNLQTRKSILLRNKRSGKSGVMHAKRNWEPMDHPGDHAEP